MFELIRTAFAGEMIPGFCVAGGSTKGSFPTAMEDDTQNAVRQGIRRRARERWGYEFCFWEMGAKLMLQPKVGRLWGHTGVERDAARELFRLNARDLAEEIVADESEFHLPASGMTDMDFEMKFAHTSVGELKIDVRPVAMTFEEFYVGFTPDSHPAFSVTPTEGRMERRNGPPTELTVTCNPEGKTGELEAHLCFILPEEKAFSTFYKITAKPF